VTYAVPSSTPVKTYFLGAMFYGAFVVAIVLNFTSILRLLASAIRNGSPTVERSLPFIRFAVPVVVLGIFFNRAIHPTGGLATRFDDATIGDIRTATARAWVIVQDRAAEIALSTRNPLVAVFTNPYPVNPTALQLYAQWSGTKMIFNGQFFASDVESVVNSITAADIAFVTSSLPHQLPGPRMGDDIIRALDARPDVCAVEAIPLKKSATLRVYRPNRAGCQAPAGAVSQREQ
jgi:hypothetical protein